MLNLLDNLNNRSIMVLANYRTGSTAFCNLLSKQTGYKNLDEFFHPLANHLNFEKLYQDKIIVKIMQDHNATEHWQHMIDNFLNIGLVRRNRVAQICSLYICHMTGVWHEKKEFFERDTYHVKISTDDLENQCRYIIDQHLAYLRLRHHCEIEIFYEDLQSNFSLSDYKRYPKPCNYDEIDQLVRSFLQQEGHAELNS